MVEPSDLAALSFIPTQHSYLLRGMVRGRPSLQLAIDGDVIHVDRLDLFDAKARHDYAGHVNGRAPGGSIDAELLELANVWQDTAATWNQPAVEPEPEPNREGGASGEAATQEQTKERSSQASRLVTLATALDMELFHTPEGLPFVSVAIDGHRETWPLRSKSAKHWLARQFYLEEEKAPGSQALADAFNVLEGRAIFECLEAPVFVRLAELDGRIYLDLGNEAWEAIEITRDGWRVISNPPVRFRRPRGMLPLPIPAPIGTLDRLYQFLNVAGEGDLILILSWLIACLRPRGPYPALVLQGEQGSAKSTTARILKALTDPNVAPLRAEPREPRDLMIAATNSWIIALDNISHLPPWLSDGLCRLATGGGFATRELYSDSEEAIFDAQRPTILNGIEEFITRSDLLDRAILVRLLPVLENQRRTEREFWESFERERAGILSGLLTAVSLALRESDRLKIDNLPRLADFAVWAAAAAPAYAKTAEDVLNAYAARRAESNDLPLETCPFFEPLQDVLHTAWTNGSDWAGTATELLAALESQAEDATRKQRGWPGSARALTNGLRRVAPNLRSIGIDIDFNRRESHSGRRLIVIGQREESSVTSVTFVTPESETAQSGDWSTPTGDATTPGAADAQSPDFGQYESEGDAGDEGDARFAPFSHASSDTTCRPEPATSPSFDAPETWTVTKPEGVAAILPELLAAPILGLDTETTGLDPHNDRLRLIQLATSDHVYVLDCSLVDPLLLAPLFEAAGGPVLAGHNLEFDLRFLMAAGLPIPDGDRLFDTRIAEQLLLSGTDKPGFKLADVVRRHLGVSLDKAEQRSDWTGTLTDAQINYAAADAAVLLPLSGKLQQALLVADLERAAAIEMRALPAIAWLEHAGAPFDSGQWITLADAATLAQIRLETALTEAAGSGDMLGNSTINWASPAQVAKLLRDRGHDVHNADEAALLGLRDTEPLAALLLDYREAARKASAYGVEFVAKHLHERTGRIHAAFFQIGAASGRMACLRPNLQNVPRDPAYRACFRPEAGRALVKADYSQIELRLAAQISGDTAMRAVFNRGADLHALTAAAVLGRPLDAVTRADRQLAKALNFGLIFGMGAKGFQSYAASGYGVTLSESEAADMRNKFFNTYPGLRRWYRSIRDGETETRTLSGRRRLHVERFTEKLNSPVQGSGADVIKLALARLWETRATVPGAAPALCIHDEIVIECDAEQAEPAAAWLTAAMVGAGAELMPDVPTVVDVAIARDWAGGALC
ncbi:MAG: DNA polymerase [Dehalococcoidia bacterium]